jgi:transglutaminase-like putative cysteine protease
MRCALLLLLCSITATSTAQAPHITPDGDPSVKADTIYRLAVDPAEHEGESFVYLLDDGVMVYQADGQSRQSYRQVVQILDQEAVENWAEQQFSYEPGHQKLTINWIRVVKPDGEVVSAAPTHVQDSDVPATMGNPVYADRKVRRLSLSGVAVGTIVDYSYTLEELKPYRSGDFLWSWSITTGLNTRRSRYIVDMPASVEPRILERNVASPVRITTANGRRVYTWAAADIPKPESEPFAADSNGVFQSVAVAAPASWQSISAWYAGLARDRYSLTPELERKLHELVAGARTLDDSLSAVQRWVAQDIRYVSLSLGIGGYQPRTPAEVFKTQYGDCKDKATIFVAMAQRMGVEAYPVLLNSGAKVERSLPSIDQFNHAIAALRIGGNYVYVDLTSELTPYGALPGPDQGAFALVVHPDGHADEVVLPEDPASANLSETLYEGELTPEGIASVRYTERASGLRQYGLRNLFTTPLDSTKRARFIQALAGNTFPGARGDSLEVFDGKDLKAKPRIALSIHEGQAAKISGQSAILNLPPAFSSMAGLQTIATQLESTKQRIYPIEVTSVVGPILGVSEMKLTLPEGWHADLPPGVSASSDYGEYRSEYTQNGRELRIYRRMEGRRGVKPPEGVHSLITWLRAVAKDDVQYIVLQRGTAVGK